MRELIRDCERLAHMLVAIERIERYTSGKSYEDFVADDMMYYAVVKNIEMTAYRANVFILSLMYIPFVGGAVSLRPCRS